MAAEGQSNGMVSDMEVPMKQRCGDEFLHAEKMISTDIHLHLLNGYGDQRVNVSTVRQWVVRFSSGDINMKDKPHSRRPCTAVTPWNEECLDQFSSPKWHIATRELRTELNISFSALGTVVKMLKHHKVCSIYFTFFLFLLDILIFTEYRWCKDKWKVNN